ADEADVREQLHLEAEVLLLARLARLHFPRRAIRGRREVRVAEAAAAALRDEHALACDGEVGEKANRLARIAGLFIHERADRHGELEVHARMAGTVRAFAVGAAPRREFGMKAVVDERVGMRACDDEDRYAGAAVASARAAARA